MDRLFLWVVQLGKAAQKHCRSGDVLIVPSKLWGIVPPIHGVALDPTGATPGAARRFMRTGRSVVRRACRRRWRLVQLLLSLLLAVLPCERGGLRTRVWRGVSLQGLRCHQWLSRSVCI